MNFSFLFFDFLRQLLLFFDIQCNKYVVDARVKIDYWTSTNLEL